MTTIRHLESIGSGFISVRSLWTMKQRRPLWSVGDPLRHWPAAASSFFKRRLVHSDSSAIPIFR